MNKKHPVAKVNLERFFAINEQLREVTAHSETQFFAQFADISVLQVQIILSIHFHHPCKMTQIAQSANLTLGSVTQIIDKLEEMQYVKRLRSTEDRRVIFVELTTKGREVVAAHQRHVKKVSKEILQKFNKDEQAQLLNFFHRMVE
ncbi:MAG: MarR family transcriptional regulator [Legionellales bacterium]|nr:MarR family transcriptional regulator [Legionellales bacterium]